MVGIERDIEWTEKQKDERVLIQNHRSSPCPVKSMNLHFCAAATTNHLLASAQGERHHHVYLVSAEATELEGCFGFLSRGDVGLGCFAVFRHWILSPFY